MRLGAQIADALTAAHVKRLIHRDLKLANIMVMKTGVKVLDFGVAKFHEQPEETLTASRMLVGTPAYMAPEQLEGQSCDARSDIFALGLVLYEMATGKRALAGQAQQAPLDGIPERLAHVIERCLARDPEDRWQSAGDLRRELEWANKSPTAPPAPTQPRRTPRKWMGVAAVVVVAVASSAAWFAWQRGQTSESPRSLRLSVNLPYSGFVDSTHSASGALGPSGGNEISPDGRLVAFVAYSSGTENLWIRPLDSLVSRELAGTDGAGLPFWSPDSKSIGFFAAGKLKRLDVADGHIVTLCDVTSKRGGAWNADGVIVFNGYNDGPLLQVSASGGNPTPLTTIDEARGENSHRFPQFLPDGRFLYLVRTNDVETWGVYVGSLDSPSEKGHVLANTTSAWYAPGKDRDRGYLLWVRNDRLVAQPFDIARAALSGEVVPVADEPFAGIVGRSFFSVSNDGTLLYLKAPGRNAQLT